MMALKGFLKAIDYYRRFIYFYTQVTTFVIHLTKQTHILGVWTKEFTKAFNKFKKQLSSAHVLILPNWAKLFEVYVDASNFAIKSVLSQKD